MPETTETTTFRRPAEEVFDLLADFGNLADWDPMFDRSHRLDDGPLGVGSRFHVEGSMAGRDLELEMEIVEYHRPDKVLLRGTGDGFTTVEDLRITPAEEGCEVSYHSAFETEHSDLLDAASKPAFVLIGKRAMSGMRDWIGA